MTIYFEIQTKDGQLYTGAVAANGGFLGGGAAHMGRDREREVAIKELTRIISFVNRTGDIPPGLASKPGGLCVLYPPEYFTDDYDNRRSIRYIPLAQATFRVIN